MTTAGPAIVSVVIGDVKVKSEALVIQGHRTVEVGHLKDDGDETVLLTWHHRMMPDEAPERQIWAG